MSSNIEKVSFLDVNFSDCPGMTITTLEGNRVGIYAQAGLGFILYDYSANRRLGICSFDQLSLSQYQESIKLNGDVQEFAASFYRGFPMLQWIAPDGVGWNVFFGQDGRITIRNESTQNASYVPLQRQASLSRKVDIVSIEGCRIAQSEGENDVFYIDSFMQDKSKITLAIDRSGTLRVLLNGSVVRTIQGRLPVPDGLRRAGWVRVDDRWGA